MNSGAAKQIPSNLLISSLAATVQDAVAKRITYVQLPLRTFLYRAEEVPTHAYFLTSGLASIVSMTSEGLSAEIGMIGREGLVGALHLFGPGTDLADCFMQTDGAAWRIARTDLAQLFEESTELRSRILEFAQSYGFMMTKIACCNRLHDAVPRLARWLLMAKDRLGVDEFPFTHDMLGMLVGSNRPTVTQTLGELQRSGLVRISRSHVAILRPYDLGLIACECLSALQERMQAQYGLTSD